MGYAIVSFVIVFALLSILVAIAFNRKPQDRRLSDVVAVRRTVLDPKADEVDIGRRLQHAAESFGAFTESLWHAAPKGDATGSKSGPSVIRRRLTFAGYRSDSAESIFNGFKVAVPLLLCALVGFTGLYEWSPFIVFLVAGGVGYLLPDFWLDHSIKEREYAVRSGLPNFLDLLVVCLEAGLSLDQAALRSSEELRSATPVMSDEVGLVMIEMQAGRPRTEAWARLTERTNVDTLRTLVSIVIQADKFGTGVSRTLRMHSETMRTRAMHRVEETAQKATVKLVFPLVLFIFPALFVVLLGPAIIAISEAFTTF